MGKNTYSVTDKKYPSNQSQELNREDVSRIIEMAWEDRTPFEAIQTLYGLSEPDTVKLMRQEVKASSFRLWRKRVNGRQTKHLKLRPEGVLRAYCSTQYKHRRP